MQLEREDYCDKTDNFNDLNNNWWIIQEEKLKVMKLIFNFFLMIS